MIYYVPIVSMRSYETGNYNLEADGNIVRTKSFIQNYIRRLHGHEDELIHVFGPKGIDTCEKLKDLYMVHPTPLEAYPSNAKESREDKDRMLMSALEHSIVYDPVEPLTFIIESPTLAKELFAYLYEHKMQAEIWFWNPVSATLNSKPSFMSDDSIKELDEVCTHLATKVILATKSQVDYYKSKGCSDDRIILFEDFIEKKDIFVDRDEVKHLKEFFGKMFPKDWKLAFFPFRLTDKGYRFKETCDYILSDECPNKYVLFVSDPNESGLGKEYSTKDESKLKIIKVPTDRKTIYSFMSLWPCIYNEDYDIHHVSLEEIKYLKGSYYRLADDNKSIGICRRFK